MKNYYVYILRCKDNSYYTGISSDPDKRVWQHNEGLIENAYTYHRRPVELIYSMNFENVYDAIIAEKQIKGWSRKKKDALINGDFDLLHKLAICKNNSSHVNSPFDSAQGDIKSKNNNESPSASLRTEY